MSENGWGKGSINNLNGWGAAAINNEIGFGDSQLRSYSGETDIDGGTGIPSIVSAPVISGATTLGSVLSTTNGTWIAKPSATYTYQWYRNDSNIVGATSSTYTLVNEDGGTNITCGVTATNDFGSTSATSNTLAIPAFTDADAQAFITAASITNPTQQTAINQLVTDLKGYGIWTKMKALYPFVGGTASTHKFNLKDPRDLNAAYRLVFSGGWTHSSNGALPNGTNGFANTFLNEQSTLAINNAHVSIYSRTNSDGLFCDIGVATTNVVESTIYSKFSNVFYPRIQNTNSGISNTTSSQGLFLSNRVNSTQIRAFQNNVLKLITNSSLATNNSVFYIGALNRQTVSDVAYYSPRQYAFASIGDGLTDTEAANFYTAVQTFNTTLNRQV